MKKSLLSVATLVACMTVFVFAEDKAEKKAPSTQPVAVNKVCPVGGDEIDPNLTVQHDGKTIALCCESCVAKFKKNPEKYMKDLK